MAKVKAKKTVGQIRSAYNSEKLIRPAILLLLKNKPSHGYELLKTLSDSEINDSSIDTGKVYRSLREMEKDGLISSKWDIKGSGPAKRIYAIMPAANKEIDLRTKEIEKEIKLLGDLLRQLNKYAYK